MSHRRLVDALEQTGPKRALIDNVIGESQAPKRRTVQHSAPLAVAASVESVRVFEAKKGFCLAVPSLLSEVSARGLPPMVPDKCTWCECDPVARLLQPPADVHIVAGFPVGGVEAANGQESVPAKRH